MAWSKPEHERAPLSGAQGKGTLGLFGSFREDLVGKEKVRKGEPRTSILMALPTSKTATLMKILAFFYRGDACHRLAHSLGTTLNSPTTPRWSETVQLVMLPQW